MKVTRIRDELGRDFTVRDLVDGYYNNPETSQVLGFGGRLDIRPEYQREFVYDDKQAAAVIETIYRGFPLNTMYWVKNVDETTGETRYEVLDGQQRSISICSFIRGMDGKGNGFSVLFKGNNLPKTYATLQEDEQERILNYPLEIYVCEGTDSEKLEWFNVINTVGVKLSEQELRNSTYHGPFVSSAKRYFSKEKGRGVLVANTVEGQYGGKEAKLLNDSGDHTWLRQGYMETALMWIADREGMNINEYMAQHKNDENANELFDYFCNVINWVRSTFSVYRKEMKNIPWGIWYNAYKEGKCTGPMVDMTPEQIETEISRLLADDEVQTVKGIYEFLFDGDPRHLSLREFDLKTRRMVYEKQNHRCVYCMKEGNNTEYAFEEMHADHIQPWSKGGKTVEENCQMLCKKHNEQKSNKW